MKRRKKNHQPIYEFDHLTLRLNRARIYDILMFGWSFLIQFNHGFAVSLVIQVKRDQENGMSHGWSKSAIIVTVFEAKERASTQIITLSVWLRPLISFFFRGLN